MTKPALHRRVNTCPTPAQEAYETERDRTYWAKRHINERLHDGRTSPPLYGYLCPCGALHLTKRPSWDGRANDLVYEVDAQLQAWAIGKG